MQPENQNNEMPRVAALGENVYEQQPENLKLPQTEEENYFGKPDRYDYSSVELPENYCYNEELLNEFNELAGKYNLSQKSANELMSVAVKLTKLMNDNYSKTMAEQNREKINNYKQLLNVDSEIGGSNLSRTMNTANLAYSEFANADVQSLLTETGLNCHPQIVKMFYNIGKRMQNDSVLGINSGAVLKENREDILFPTM